MPREIKRFFTADTHFGHGTIADLRGFADTEEHDARILAWINMMVSKRDELFILGDFAWKNPGKYRSQIQCQHVRLVKGNHDKPMANRNVFGETPEILRTKIRDVRTVLSHYPQAHWDGSHRGAFHLYGHTHATKEAHLDAAFPGRRSIDVGIDNAMRLLFMPRPFSEVELYILLSARPGHDILKQYEQERIE
jgi:calcineurin-like phosphoesterase family protein